LKGIGAAKFKIMNKQGILTIGDVLSSPQPQDFVTTKVEAVILNSFLLDKPPTPTDHKLAANPYKSLHGDDWHDVVKRTTKLRPFVPITDLVTHIFDESQRIMTGTNFEHDWFFYHDALSLMTAESCKKFMEEKGYYKHWLLPKKGLNAGTSYANHPVGNSPELMPLDCSLFSYLNLSVSRHVVYTSHLDEADHNKFSTSTMVRAQSAYNRLWNGNPGAPSPSQIVNDIRNTLPSIRCIYENNGRVVPNLGNRSGRRFQRTGTWGGHRAKSPSTLSKTRYIHPDAIAARKNLLRDILLTHQNSRN
jgi:hypothetical protein